METKLVFLHMFSNVVSQLLGRRVKSRERRCVWATVYIIHIFFNYVSLVILWCQYCHTSEVKFQINLKNTSGKILIKQLGGTFM